MRTAWPATFPLQGLRAASSGGEQVATNLDFHYGLVNWFIGQSVLAKPTTRFVVPYLTLMGRSGGGLRDRHHRRLPAHEEAYAKRAAAQAPDDPRPPRHLRVLDRKGTLLTRPLERLLEDPHLLSGWLSLHRGASAIENGRLSWIRNPLGVLRDTYDYLDMAYDPKGRPRR